MVIGCVSVTVIKLRLHAPGGPLLSLASLWRSSELHPKYCHLQGLQVTVFSGYDSDLGTLASTVQGCHTVIDGINSISQISRNS